ncbi:MAG: glycosyltransferase family 2 protein, partial [Planctomycetota bacterium]
MEKLGVSVVIPNYNRCRDVIECINSIKASTCQPKEIIVVDDCSTDDSVDQLKGLDVMLLEHGENRGQGAARNSGAENATGEIVVFIDSDVVVYPDVLKKMTDRFKSDRTLSVVVGVPDKSNKYHNLATIHF